MKHNKRENRRNTVLYEHASREEKRGRRKERRERSPQQLHISIKARCQPASLSACTPRSLPTCLSPFLPPCLPPSLPASHPASLPPCLPPWRGSMCRRHAVKLEWQLSSCQAAGGASAGHMRRGLVCRITTASRPSAFHSTLNVTLTGYCACTITLHGK